MAKRKINIELFDSQNSGKELQYWRIALQNGGTKSK